LIVSVLVKILIVNLLAKSLASKNKLRIW
jgi:hypothetical protein